MNWFRLALFFVLFVFSFYSENLATENASSFYNAIIPPLVNFALLLLSCIYAILLTLEHAQEVSRGFRLVFHLLIFLIAVNFLSSSIRAPTNYEILSSLKKSNFSNVTTDSNGYMVLNGLIGKPTLKTLEENLLFSKQKILIIDSHGGAIDSAIKIASLVKKYNITVVVENECSSACVIVAAASNTLMAMPNSKFGFHQASIFGNSNTQHSKYWALTATTSLISELRRSGIPQKILNIAEKTPPNEMHYVSAAEMFKYGVVKRLLK